MLLYNEDPIMDQVHRIREQLNEQYLKSGLSFSDWLKTTEKDLDVSLAEVGFKIIRKDGLHYLVEIIQ